MYEGPRHGNVLRKADKLSATIFDKLWSTSHITHLRFDDKSQTNLRAFQSAVSCF